MHEGPILGWIQRSLRRKVLLVFLVFSFIPLIIVGISNYSTTYNILEKVTGDLSDQAMDKTALYISNKLQTLIDFTVYYSTDYKVATVAGALPTSSDEKETQMINLRNYIINGILSTNAIDWPVNYILLTKQGMAYTSYSFSNNGNMDNMLNRIHDETWFKVMNDSQTQNVWMGRRQDYLMSSGPANIYVACNVIYQFEKEGVFITSVSEQYIARILDGSRISDRSSIYLIDNEGACISQANNNALSYEDLVKSYSPLGSASGNSHSTISVESNRYLVFNRNLDFKGFNGQWHLIAISPLLDVQKNASAIGYLIIALALLLLSTSVILEQYINRFIMKRIIKLNSVIAEAQKGNYNVSASEKSSDEIGQLGSGFNKMMGSIRLNIAAIRKEEEEKRKIEIRMLQEQIKPHFIRNTLNTIRIMAQMRRAYGISQAISSFSKMIDYNFMDDTVLISVKKEIEYLEEYLFLQKLRYQNVFSSHFAIDEDVMDLKVLKLSFQPIVENSIMHGFLEKQAHGELRIEGHREPNRVVFKIIDNGVGMEPETLEKILSEKLPDGDAIGRRNIGIANVDKRIKLNFGYEYGISLESVMGQGTTVTMTFPILS